MCSKLALIVFGYNIVLALITALAFYFTGSPWCFLLLVLFSVSATFTTKGEDD